MKLALLALPVVVGLGAATFALADALADDPPQPVVVTSVGPKAMRLRVAVGAVLPCGSSSNTTLYDGPIGKGQEIDLQTISNCICIEHTFDDFPDKNWSSPETFCRPVVCTGAGRARVCRPAADPTIRVSVASNG